MNRTHLARGLCLGTACSLLLALYACANGDGGRIVVVEAEGDASSTSDGSTVIVDDSDGEVPVSEDDSAAPCNGSIVINEIQSEGTNEFIELFNSGSCDVPLAGYTVQYSAGSGSSATTLADLKAETISGGGFLVLGGPNFSGSSDLDLTSGIGSDGQIGLVKGSSTVDAVAWGTITKKVFVEGTAATKPTTSKSIGRVPDGTDTDNNKDDFQQNSPSPGAAN